MTTILDAIRNLEAAHARGEIDEDAFKSVRRSVMDLIDDAEVVDPWERAEGDEAGDAPDPWAPEPEPGPQIDDADGALDGAPQGLSDVAQMGVLAGLGFVICLGLGTWLSGDPMLAFTLSLVFFAGVTVWAAHRYDLLHEEGALLDDSAPPEEEAPPRDAR